MAIRARGGGVAGCVAGWVAGWVVGRVAGSACVAAGWVARVVRLGWVARAGRWRPTQEQTHIHTHKQRI